MLTSALKMCVAMSKSVRIQLAPIAANNLTHVRRHRATLDISVFVMMHLNMDLLATTLTSVNQWLSNVAKATSVITFWARLSVLTWTSAASS